MDESQQRKESVSDCIVQGGPNLVTVRPNVSGSAGKIGRRSMIISEGHLEIHGIGLLLIIGVSEVYR